MTRSLLLQSCELRLIIAGTIAPPQQPPLSAHWERGIVFGRESGAGRIEWIGAVGDLVTVTDAVAIGVDDKRIGARR